MSLFIQALKDPVNLSIMHVAKPRMQKVGANNQCI